ncbi:hypothetical protein [Myroides odoratimimus]|uniref:Uncharacterized protein n=1 Tax=Myroides odoratimimus TaxID=76832 RepID=A0AAI8C327_9FLAO|nr:hypothetical protein [Myroides odoratimimus]ALU25253.1 hypothetical protein AS202_03370 [Myroides odoratimimus]
MTYFIDLEGYYKSLGANVIEEYSTKSPNKNKAIRELLNGNPEQWIKEELDPIAEEFIADVKSKRKDIKEEVFTGSTYGPSKAQEMGLVDNLGTLKEVVNSLFNTNKNTGKQSESMSKKIALTALTGVLAVEALEGTDKGTYLNEEQLETINAALAGNTATIEQLTAAAETSANTITNLNSQFAELMTLAGVEASEDQEANITALSDKIADMQKKPGNAHTQASGNTNPPVEEKDSIIDMEAGHNKLFNQMNK